MPAPHRRSPAPDRARSPLTVTGPASILLAGFALLGLPGTASAQSAAEVMADARAAWEARAAGVENYTVVQRMMGVESTTYFERAEVDGTVVFRPRQVSVAGGGQSADQQFDEAFFMRDDVAERMTYEGSDEVEGNACHVLLLEDFEGLPVGEAVPGDAESSELESLRMCIDAETFVPRRMEMSGTATMNGQERPIQSVMVFSDYRDVEGLLHPFRMEMRMSGLEVSDEQQSQMAEAMARMEEQLEQLPEGQRERMRAMMESRMGAMEGAMGAAMGEPIVVETVEVRVNEGPPGGER